MTIEAQLLALHEDPSTFDQFYRSTRKFWFGIAHNMLRNRPTSGVCAEDLVQEMMCSILEHDLVAKWEGPERHGSITHFVIRFGALNLASRHLRRMRGQHQRDGSGHATQAIPHAWLRPDQIEEFELTPGVTVMIDGWLDAPKYATNEREQDVIAALQETADMDVAAAQLGISRETVMQHARIIGRRVQHAA